jgi:hypothetical protein
MDRLLWGAAQRLAGLSGAALVLVGALLVRDAFEHRCAPVADLAAWSSALLILGALLAMTRARSFFGPARAPPPAQGGPYRRSARSFVDERSEEERARAIRRAAWAFVALALAGAFAVVAAAAR